jgi:hypothetical protein
VQSRGCSQISSSWHLPGSGGTPETELKATVKHGSDPCPGQLQLAPPCTGSPRLTTSQLHGP